MENIKVSIIIPVYNCRAYLNRCLDSILAQTFTNYDVILVNDGSNDGSDELCDKYALHNSNIHVIHQENSGVSVARNVGLRWAIEESPSNYISFIDSDDWVSPRYLEGLCKAILSSNSEISACGFIKVSSDNETKWCDSLPIKEISVSEFYINKRVDATVVWGKLYSKKLFEDVSFPIGTIHEDEFVTYKLLFQYENINYVCVPLYAYYQNESSIMHQGWDLRKLDVLKAFEQQIAFFKACGKNDACLDSLRLYVRELAKALNQIKRKYPNCKEKDEVRKKLKKAYKDYRACADMMTKVYVFCMAMPFKSNEALKVARKVRNAYQVISKDGIQGVLCKILRSEGK